MTMFNQIGLMIAEHLAVVRCVIISVGFILCLIPGPHMMRDVR